MIEQMKNKNEYREGGNLYLKKIKSSECCVKIDDRYIITCNIHQRGRREYSFCKGDKWITKLYCVRKLWLSPDAETTILHAVELFDERLNRLMGEGSRAITMEDAKLSVFLTGFSGKLDAAIKYDNEDTKQMVMLMYVDTCLDEILRCLQFLRTLRDCESKELLQNPTKENIMKHPFIIAAEKDGDIKTVKKIKMFYRLEDAEDCSWLAKITGQRILPKLPEEYNKEYYIDVDTLTRKSFALLSHSGYTILHRPYFAMKGSTHSKITLNPHTKIGVDAAKTDTDSISFDDFLGMFDGYEHN